MNNSIVSVTINHPQAGLVTVEKQESTLKLSYADNEQCIEWNVPEPLIAVSSEEGHLCFTYSLTDNAVLKKKLYFIEGAFTFRIPDGISYYTSTEVETLPHVFFQAREGSSVIFNHPPSAVNLQVYIEKTGCAEADGKKYFTEYTFISGNRRRHCRLYAGDSITVGDYWICQSPRATTWPVFLVNDCALEAQQVANICP